ncbi:MAG: mevalonate kinase, partial [Candidatus Saccharibacteria bacterium]
SKLLLFGEYGLMFDAMALSVPFSRFYGSLEFDTNGLQKDSTHEIRKFFGYLSFLKENDLHYPFNLKNFKVDLEKGLCFNSNIPFQYGLGSSGALIAALFSRYAASFVEKDQLSIPSVKEDLALLESYFHSKSSGLDPLVSYLNQPLLFGEDKTIQPLDFDLSKTNWSIALIDTKTTGATGPLVQHFMECMKLPDFNTAFNSNYIPANNGCIQALLKNDSNLFFSCLEQFIAFELDNLKPMFPLDFGTLVKEALNEKVFIKLLGSGGGGFLLAFASDEQLLKQWAKRKVVQLIWVSSIP